MARKKIETGIFAGMIAGSNMHKNAQALVYAIVCNSKLSASERRDRAVKADMQDRIYNRG